MDSTAVRAEKIQADDVASRSSYRLPFWTRAGARPLALAGGDAVAALLANVVAMLAISVPPSPYFHTIDTVFIPLALACCLVAGLYDGDQLDPVGRLRLRAHAVVGSSLVELLAIALQAPITGMTLYIGARAVLLLILGFYIEYATESRFARSSPHGASLIQSFHTGRRVPDWFKRAADAGVALVAGFLALPFLAASAAAIWLVDHGPVFYSQKRIGQGGRVIKVVKIRTMYVDAEQRLEKRLQEDAAARAEWERFFKLRDDPRVLGWVGRFLRRTSLDELPQIWNILRGDMSLVGPRPFPPYHLDSFDEAFRQKRQSCKPGLTGLWQVSARSNGDLDVQRNLDLSYIANRSFWLDLYILLSTVPAVLKGTGAC
jgi:lipopolysaccharide/colanic/teichoic acid biosynthesis glycosyltransferase